RHSAAIRVMEILVSQGADVTYHDPHVPTVQLESSLFSQDGRGRATLNSIPLRPDTIRVADCVAILVGHSSVDYDVVLANATRVFDAVNATAGRTSDAPIERL